MDAQLTDSESLVSRLRQVENERDELRRDIEQLCMQQGGPGYLAVATRIHFQRTAALEQEIENLKKNLAACIREKSNMHEELSEAYRVKSQIADLHAAEVLKNVEAEKQLKFFQGCVAAAFSERDNSIMEAEKAKENEELMLQKLSPLQSRVEELTSKFAEEKKLTEALQTDLEQQKNQNEIFCKVINKFYEIRQYSLKGFCEDQSWEAKCECLLNDSLEKWDFNEQGETSTSKYISALEDEVETLRKSLDNLQNKLSLGLEIENHLKKRVHDLEKNEKKISLSEERIKKGISELLNFHVQHKAYVMNLLAGEQSHMKSIIDVVEEKLNQYVASTEQSWRHPEGDVMPEDKDCRDVHVNAVAEGNVPGLSTSSAITSSDTSEALAQALQAKVSTLLLLSQQEERHLLEKNVNVALQKKVEELQRNLLQVTNEKVKALMGLAHVKREYQLLQEKIRNGTGEREVLGESGEKGIVRGQDGRMKNLLKKSYLKRWIGTLDNAGEAQLNYDGTFSNSSYGMDVARMKIENATLKESLESMEHLTSAGRRLRLSLLKIQESVASGGSDSGLKEAIDDIVTEAKLVKTALGSSLPVSWSAEVDVNPLAECSDQETANISGDSTGEKVDFVSAVGFELLETLIFAAQVLKEYVTKRSSLKDS